MYVPGIEERDLLMKVKMETDMGRNFKYDADCNTEDAEQSGQETLKVPKRGNGAIVGLFGVLVGLMILIKQMIFAKRVVGERSQLSKSWNYNNLNSRRKIDDNQGIVLLNFTCM